MRVLRGALSGLLVSIGLAAASISLGAWVGSVALAHNTHLLDSLTGAPSASSATSSVASTLVGTVPGLDPAQSKRAASAVHAALASPKVDQAVSGGTAKGNAALEAAVAKSDPSLGAELARHPLSSSSLNNAITTLQRTVSSLPGRLLHASRLALMAALVVLGIGLVLAPRRAHQARRVGRWALVSGGTGLLAVLLLPAAVRLWWPHGPLVNLARGLGAGASLVDGVFVTLLLAGLGTLLGARVASMVGLALGRSANHGRAHTTEETAGPMAGTRVPGPPMAVAASSDADGRRTWWL
jgi:hypothetical protein